MIYFSFNHAEYKNRIFTKAISSVWSCANNYRRMLDNTSGVEAIYLRRALDLERERLYVLRNLREKSTYNSDDIEFLFILADEDIESKYIDVRLKE